MLVNLTRESLFGILDIQAVPGYGQSEDAVGIDNFKIISIDSKIMQVEVNFTNPVKISTGETSDMLKIKFLDNLFFQSKNNPGKFLESNYVLEKVITI